MQQTGKVNTIKIKCLNATTNQFADCPEAIITLGNSDTLYTSLLDSGAQSNILPWNIFQELEIGTDKVKKVQNSLNLQGTTGIHEDAIYGTLTINCFCLLKKKFENGRSFGRSKVTFLICSPEVKLQKIILGSPWLKSVHIDLQMHEDGDTAKARLFKEGSYHRCSLQLKQIRNLQMTSCEKIIETDSLSYSK